MINKFFLHLIFLQKYSIKNLTPGLVFILYIKKNSYNSLDTLLILIGWFKLSKHLINLLLNTIIQTA